MPAKTNPINTLNPPGDSDPKQGDDHIRTLAKALIELLTVDHYVGVANPWGNDASGDETGEHAKVMFHEAISDPSVDAGKGVLFIKGTPPELYFRDEDDGTVIQFTSGGEILFGSLSSIAKDTYLKAIDDAGTSTIDLIKGNASDVAVIKTGAELSTSGDPTTAAGIACKEYVDDEIVAAFPDDDAFGTWTMATQGSSTQAASDGFILIVIDEDIDSGDSVSVKTDSSNPPTTVRAVFEGLNTGVTGRMSIMCPVKKNDYYLIESTSLSPTAYWLPVGA